MVAEIKAEELKLQPSANYEKQLSGNRTLALVVISGEGKIKAGEETEVQLGKKDYFVVNASDETVVKLSSENESELTLFVIEVPTNVDYPLYTD